MDIYRGITSCPSCNKDYEIWFRYGKVVPLANIDCDSCAQLFSASDFVTSFIELRSNTNIRAQLAP